MSEGPEVGSHKIFSHIVVRLSGELLHPVANPMYDVFESSMKTEETVQCSSVWSETGVSTPPCTVCPTGFFV